MRNMQGASHEPLIADQATIIQANTEMWIQGGARRTDDIESLGLLSVNTTRTLGNECCAKGQRRAPWYARGACAVGFSLKHLANEASSLVKR
jgi:hypothetical protein